VSMRLLIVDDDARFRALARTTALAAGLTVVGEAADAREARALAAALGPDLVLVDVHLGADDGVALAAELRGERRRVVLVSSDPEAGGVGAAVPFVAKADLPTTDLLAVAAAR
jgi:DNA-binding NarL/FixJ family response regulator